MNSFALLQDDVEDADDLSPAPKLVAQRELPAAAPAPKTADPVVPKKAPQPADRAGRWREGGDFHAPGEYRGRGRGRGRGFRGRGRGGYRGRGRGGGYGGGHGGGYGGAHGGGYGGGYGGAHGGGYGGGYGGAPGASQGGSHGSGYGTGGYGGGGHRIEREGGNYGGYGGRDSNRDAPRQDRERRDGGWESRDANAPVKNFVPNGASVPQAAPAAPTAPAFEVTAPSAPEALNETKSDNEADTNTNFNDAKENDKEGSDNEVDSAEKMVKEMTLDEFMAEKKAKAMEMRALSSKSSRKANNGKLGVGGKMSVLKKKGAEVEAVAETSIMSAVPIKRAVEERAAKDSTHAAVADNAKNQQFFKNNPAHRGRGYGNGDFRRSNQGDDDKHGNRGHFGGRGGRGRGGSRGAPRGAHRGGYGRRTEDYGGNRRYGDDASRNRPYSSASSQINVDDKNAFPALNANA